MTSLLPADDRAPTAPTALREVLDHDGIRSVYQPLVELATGRLVGYEALARGPVGPLERPDHLFAAAREHGLLAELDAACRRSALRGAVGHGLVAPLTLFVNVEPEVLESAPLDDLVALAAQAPGRLRVVLEITERALTARPGRAAADGRSGSASWAGAWPWTTSGPSPRRWPSSRSSGRTW